MLHRKASLSKIKYSIEIFLFNDANYERVIHMQDSRLFSKHHIGGRNGRGGFEMPGLNQSIASTFYEADADCCPQIEAEQRAAGYGGVEVIPKCIGLSGQSVEFNINFEPYTSSILNLNSSYRNFYFDMGRFDYDYGTAMSPARTVWMQTVSLDELRPKYPIDFLSLDTQGSELDILHGATRSLTNVVGIECEVSFRQIYEDGPVAGAITQFLDSLDFEFIKFTTLTLDAPRSMPTLGRLEKMHTFADALFLRRPRANMPIEQQSKLIFAALAYGQVEYAAYCVRSLGLSTGISLPDEDLKQGWALCVDQFCKVVANETSLPNGIGNVTTHEESIARFAVSTQAVRLDLHPARVLKSLFVKLPRNIQIAIIRITHAHQFVDYFFGGPSDLEALYQRAGRAEYAKRLRISRFRRIFPLF